MISLSVLRNAIASNPGAFFFRQSPDGSLEPVKPIYGQLFREYGQQSDDEHALPGALIRYANNGKVTPEPYTRDRFPVGLLAILQSEQVAQPTNSHQSITSDPHDGDLLQRNR